MIKGFGNALAENLFEDLHSATTRRFPADLRRAARRKLLYLHDASELKDLMVPPGNRPEKLRGDLSGLYSMRINDQWRVIFSWNDGHASDVKTVDYHK